MANTRQDGIKLGMLAKRVPLDPVAGQGPDVQYCLVVSGLRMPANGNCYLAQSIDRNHVSLEAYIDRNGHVFATHDIVEAPPARTPELMLRHYTDDPSCGTIDVAGDSGQTTCRGYYSQVKDLFARIERPTVDENGVDNPIEQISPYIEYRVFLAQCYLTHVLLPKRPGGLVDAGTNRPLAPADLLAPLSENSLPDALGLIASKIDVKIATTPAQVSGFEHWARRVLAECSFEKAREVTSRHDVSTVKLGSSGSIYLTFSSEVEGDDKTLLLGIETALNRIYRTQQVLSARGMNAAPDFQCAEIDTQVLGATAQRAKKLLGDSQKANSFMTLEDGVAKRGGEWDVRTRFATAAESLPFPLRIEYDFRCNVANGVFAIEFVLPRTSQMPQTVFNRTAGFVHQTPQMLAAMAREYALRTSVALAAAAFATSVSIELVSVTARHESLEGSADFSLRFDRIGFLGEIDELIRRISTTPLGDDAGVKALRPRLQYQADKDGAVPWVRFTSELLAHSERAQAMGDDKRELPERLAKRLRAKHVCDLDAIGEEDDPQFERFHHAAEMEQDTPLLAISTLEEIVTNYEVEHVGEEGRWFDSLSSRALLAMFEPGEDAPVILPPSYGFALGHLADLYEEELEDHERSLAYARRLIEVSPTCSRGYSAADQALMAQGRYSEAAETLTGALRFATDPGVIAYLYYRLAFALWNLNRTSEAVACYTMVPDDHPALGPLKQKELSALMASLHMSEKPGPLDARAALAEAHIPVAPTTEVTERLHGLAAELVDAGVFSVALPLLTRVNAVRGTDAGVATMKSLMEED